MGKGSRARPIPEPEKYRDNWDKIFGKKDPVKQEPKQQPIILINSIQGKKYNA